MLTFTLEGDRLVIEGLNRASDQAREAVRIGIGRTTLQLLTAVKEDKLSGQVLQVRTGRLRRSINQRVDVSGGSVVGTVGTNVSYGKTHELGLTIKAHLVEAKKAKALRFQLGGKTMFRKSVMIPAVKMPKRSFLMSALQDLVRADVPRKEIEKAMREQIPILSR
jgi:phage gpG-like protein